MRHRALSPSSLALNKQTGSECSGQSCSPSPQTRHWQEMWRGQNAYRQAAVPLILERSRRSVGRDPTRPFCGGPA